MTEEKNENLDEFLETLNEEEEEVTEAEEDKKTSEDKETETPKRKKFSELSEDEKREVAEKQAKKWNGILNRFTPKEEKKSVKEENSTESSLSPADIIALTKADIDTDDIQEVIDYAKYRKVSIKEAINDPILASILEKKNEKRQSAKAMNTRSGRGKVQKLTPEQVLEKAKRGELPEPGSEEAELLFKARRGLK